MRFSQRMGLTPVKTVLQVESIDEALKNRLWNVILEEFFYRANNDSHLYSETERGQVCKKIWKEFFNFPIDKIPTRNTGGASANQTIAYIRNWFFSEKWYDIYDFIEFIARDRDFIFFINNALEKEVAGYRIVDGLVVQITSELEIAEIEEALSNTDGWSSINIHLKTALDLLSDRQNPDYRNSIKESISAVESMTIKIGGNTNGKFADSLTEIEKKFGLHGSLKRAFAALYGYTSDEGGIRHPLNEDSTIPTFEDAKFMLVICSAFINYLKAKIEG